MELNNLYKIYKAGGRKIVPTKSQKMPVRWVICEDIKQVELASESEIEDKYVSCWKLTEAIKVCRKYKGPLIPTE